LAGKVRNLNASVGARRMKGIALQYWSEKYQRWVSQSWPKARGPAKGKQLIGVKQFQKAVKLIKYSVDLDMTASIDLSANTPFLPRDLRMKAAYGTLIEARLRNGVLLYGGRTVVTSASDLLDQISTVKGSLVQRGAAEWDAVPPSSDGFILQFNGTSGLWEATLPPTPPAAAGLECARFTDNPAMPGFDTALARPAAFTFSNSGKTVQPNSGSPYNVLFGNQAQFTGKRYYEFQPGSTSFLSVGWTGPAGRQWNDGGARLGESSSGDTYGQVGWVEDGDVRTQYASSGGAQAMTLASIMGADSSKRACMALDIDALLGWFRQDGGAWNANVLADPATGVGGIDCRSLLSNAANGLVWPACSLGNTAASSMYLTSADFTQTVPAGFSAWTN
jgi:hypothetical protein